MYMRQLSLVISQADSLYSSAAHRDVHLEHWATASVDCVCLKFLDAVATCAYQILASVLAGADQ